MSADYVLVLIAAESGAPSSVWGPFTEEEARTLNGALWEQHIPNAVMYMNAKNLSERLFVGSLVVWDRPAPAQSGRILEEER